MQGRYAKGATQYLSPIALKIINKVLKFIYLNSEQNVVCDVSVF